MGLFTIPDWTLNPIQPHTFQVAPSRVLDTSIDTNVSRLNLVVLKAAQKWLESLENPSKPAKKLE